SLNSVAPLLRTLAVSPSSRSTPLAPTHRRSPPLRHRFLPPSSLQFHHPLSRGALTLAPSPNPNLARAPTSFYR
ncbi:Os11g0429200, partial [Oryza sativa Japonica Group]